MLFTKPKTQLEAIQGKIVILPESAFKPWRIKGCRSVQLIKRDFKNEIIISPSRFEFYNTAIPFQLRLLCDKNNVKLVACGSQNFLPYYSMFAHEVVILPPNPDADPKWYKDKNGQSSNKIVLPSEILNMHNFLEVDKDGMKFWKADVPWKNDTENDLVKIAKRVNADDIGAKFADWTVYIHENSYKIFKNLSADNFLPKNIIVAEMKANTGIQKAAIQQTQVKMKGANQEFQKELVLLTGKKDYMAVQILCSNLRNWHYVCGGGSSNLMMAIPMRTLFTGDGMLHDGIAKQFAMRRYGELGTKFPIHVRKSCLGGDELPNAFRKSLKYMEEWSKKLSTFPKPLIDNFVEQPI